MLVEEEEEEFPFSFVGDVEVFGGGEGARNDAESTGILILLW